MDDRSVTDVIADWIGDHSRGMSRFSLKYVFSAALLVLCVIAVCLFLVFDMKSQERQMEDALLEEARVFSREMDAVWQFIDNSYYIINYNEDGEFEFKGLYCSMVGKGVGKLFSANSDYSIRYTNFNPRNSYDLPDAFESEALTAFNEGRAEEWYGVVEYEGDSVFRYVRGLEVKESCLQCHGEPVGELDFTGHEKEGWTLDTVGGAISIVIPTDQRREAVLVNVASDAIFFSLLTFALGFMLYFFVKLFFLRPLERMSEGFGRIGEGKLGIVMEDSSAGKEIAVHIRQFNEMAAELKVLYEDLEGKVEARTLDLVKANELLEKQRHELEEISSRLSQEVEYKSDLLSMVNHELRTPLTSIITMSQLSLEMHEPPTDREKRAWESVNRNAALLLNMVNNMLDLARLEAGGIPVFCEPVELGDIVNLTKSGMDPLAKAASVCLVASISPDVPLVEGDYEKIQRICENLLGNAVKFTPEGGNVAIETLRDGETEDVLLRVSDTGVGIPADQQERIFERFVQMDSASTRKYAGSGLGLALVKGYASAQGFEIELESEQGRGSVFTVRIPSDKVIE